MSMILGARSAQLTVLPGRRNVSGTADRATSVSVDDVPILGCLPTSVCS